MDNSRSFKVVACSIPIVYTLEGDHDPNGMVYTLEPIKTLLDWAKDRWQDDDERLPKLHIKRQRIQLAVDGLERLEQMICRLQSGCAEELDLLKALIKREESTTLATIAKGEGAEGGDDLEEILNHSKSARWSNGTSKREILRRALTWILFRTWTHGAKDDTSELSHRAKAIWNNVTKQVDDLVFVLKELGGLEGLNAWRPAVDDHDAESDAKQQEQSVCLVRLSSEQRQGLLRHWRAQAKLVDDAIADWFERLEADPERCFDAMELARKSKIPPAWVKRLLLNDYRQRPDPFQPSRVNQPFDRFNPMKPIPCLRPLVLRCRVGEQVEISFEHSMRARRVGFHLQGGGLQRLKLDRREQGQHEPGTNELPHHRGVRCCDGGQIGRNPDSALAPGDRAVFRYHAEHEGIWPINDLADVRGTERGTNAHGLFGTLIVEPPGSRWLDPESGDELSGGVPDHYREHHPDLDLVDFSTWSSFLDLDIHLDAEDINHPNHREFVDFHSDQVPRSFREFTVFIHDQPEGHSGLHTGGDHSLMPLSYRAEPMHNRLPHRMREYVAHTEKHGQDLKGEAAAGETVDRRAFGWKLGDELDEQFLTARTSAGEFLERVAGEEQHHSSWLFGDPVTHVQRAYRGDPCRLRLVHSGVKETHVFHLHVHQWRAVAEDVAPPSVHGTDQKGSQLLDSITISPQCGMTIDPLYGSGSRQQSIGDIIWHCHLYPHFHHGMWGLWRSYDKWVDGSTPYPDGSYCPALRPLPGREPERATTDAPGFPWFIDGAYPMKAPPTPVPSPLPINGRRALLGLPRASAQELAAMPEPCRRGEQPGSLFIDLDGLAAQWNAEAKLPGARPRIVRYDVEVVSGRVDYNVDGWHDPRGHYYRLIRAEVREWSEERQDYQTVQRQEMHRQQTQRHQACNPEPLFPRANHGDIVEWRQFNRLGSFPADDFDQGMLPVECGLHVHLVKFDTLSADGSCTGWNYLSGASSPEAVGDDRPGELRTASLHRWVVDEEFGPCFFHDHLLANFRQKHGLFAALIAQPHGSEWKTTTNPQQTAWSEAEAVIVPPPASGLPPYREACLSIGDFIPLLNKDNKPLNPPSVLSGFDDPGTMGVNYRSAPLTFRGRDPSQWFSSSVRSRPNFQGSPGDPDTPILHTYPGERLRVRLIQGSHEEQHGFCIHGMRWRRDWGNPASALVNQQTLGISEAFTFDINPADASAYGSGDHLWHFCAIDDIWLGCWGVVRSLHPTAGNLAKFPPLSAFAEGSPAEPLQPLASRPPSLLASGSKPAREAVRTYVVFAQRVEHHYAGTNFTDPWGLVYTPVHYINDAAIRNAWERASGFDDPSAGSSAISADSAAATQPGARRPQIGHWPLPRAEELQPGTSLQPAQEPLVLRVRRGEWIRLILVNDLIPAADPGPGGDDGDDAPAGGDTLPPFGVEPFPARLPLENVDELQRPTGRTVSPRVSIHASLLRYDVAKHDGSHVGRNPDGTVPPRHGSAGHGEGHGGDEMGGGAVIDLSGHHGHANWREYLWYADEHLAPDHCADGPGSVCYLYDMADLRNHRHHGLIGAVIVESPDAVPFRPGGDPGASPDGDGWSGVTADIYDRSDPSKPVAREAVVMLQDGLRLFAYGDPRFPLPDAEPGGDAEDSGHKAINYRSQPVVHGRVSPQPSSTFPLNAFGPAQPGDTVWLRVLGGNDKPRQFGLTVHGCHWPLAPYLGSRSARGSSLNGLSPCRAETVVFTLPEAGDYAIRAGNFLWAAEQGVWSSLRCEDPREASAASPPGG